MRLPSHGKLFLRDNSGQIYCFQIDKTPIYPSDYTVCTINHISPLLPAQSGGCLHQTLGPVTARAGTGAGARARAWLIVLWLRSRYLHSCDQTISIAAHPVSMSGAGTTNTTNSSYALKWHKLLRIGLLSFNQNVFWITKHMIYNSLLTTIMMLTFIYVISKYFKNILAIKQRRFVIYIFVIFISTFIY